MVNTVSNSLANPLYWQEEQVKLADPNKSMLSQEDFFALLTQQLAYQDPSKPVDNAQMVDQMTGFTTADGITQLNDTVTDLSASMTSNKALQASSLVGRNVLIPGDLGVFDGDNPVKSAANLDRAYQDLQLRVEDEFGQLVSTRSLGSNSGGVMDFQWDGKDNKGNTLPQGNYRISVTGKSGDSTVQIPVSQYAKVSSVTLNASNGVILNLQNGFGVYLDDVQAIAEG